MAFSILNSLQSVVRVNQSEKVIISIRPDKYVNNSKVSSIISALYDTYLAPIHRVGWNKGINLTPKHIPIWEINMSSAGIEFFLHTNDDYYSLLMGKMINAWPNAAIQRKKGEPPTLNPSCTSTSLMKLSHHHMLSLDTQSRNFLTSLLSSYSLMEDKDKVIIQIVMNPVSDEWQEECDSLYEDYRNTGDLPSKVLDNPLKTAKKGIEYVLDFTTSTIQDLVGNMATEEQKGKDGFSTRKKKAVKQLAASSMQKSRYHGFKTQIRIGCEVNNKQRQKIIMKSITNSFREMDGDNRLVPATVKDHAAMTKMINERKYDFMGDEKFILSSKELEMLVQLPDNEVQKQVPNISSLQYRETEVPDALTKKGITIGEVNHKGTTKKVYYLTSHTDILCLPRVVIGQMGSGKSSYASTFARSAFVENNLNIIALDVADGRMCDQIRDSVPPEKKKDIIELDFGRLDKPIGLVWNEAVMGMDKASNRLPSELLSFLEKITGPFGPQMRRWLKKAAQAVFEDPNATVLDVILMLVDDDYRAKRIPQIKNIAVRQAWIKFASFNDKQQQMIISPVLNRLDYLLDDENMKNILCQVPKKKEDGDFALDFRSLINQDYETKYNAKCILIKVPKSVLGEAATDAIVAFLISKIWLTVQTRNKSTVLKKGVPTFLLMDEPHQFMSSAESWKDMVVESRKWRLGLVWFFHTWEQIRDESKELAKIIKSAGVHYILYNSSKDTWKELSEEISPYTIPEALEIPRYHAYVITSTPEGPAQPMLVKMEAPVDVVHPVYDNSDICSKCLDQYGRLSGDVEKEISAKELSLLGIDPSKILDDAPISDDGKFSIEERKEG